jgi:hypothetical protein
LRVRGQEGVVDTQHVFQQVGINYSLRLFLHVRLTNAAEECLNGFIDLADEHVFECLIRWNTSLTFDEFNDVIFKKSVMRILLV